MLQWLNEKFTGWIGITIFLTLGILMAIAFGAGNYVISNRPDWAAKVNGHKISLDAYHKQMNDLRRQASQQQGAKHDPSYYEKPAVKLQVVDGMIDRYLLQQSSNDLGLVVTTGAVRQQIASMPVFQVNGKFDPDTYRSVLTNARQSPLSFQQQVRGNLQTMLLPNAITATSTIGAADVTDYLKLQMQTRDLSYLVLPRPPLESTKVSDAQVAKYYKAHQSEFMNPERVAVKYIELDASQLPAGKKITDAQLKARYQQERSRFVQPEQRLVSHILIDVPKNATPAQQKAALAKAKKVDALAKAKGADFAALAKKYSDDAGSKLLGGKLGWLQKGVTNKVFEDTLFALQKGQISKPVLTPNGYEIIWLRGVRSGKVKPFSEVRDTLLAEAKKTERKKAFNDIAGKLTDLVYRDPSTLEPAAKKLNLTIEQTGLFSREGTKTGLASNPKVVKAAFSDNVLADGNTSDPITLGQGHMVVVHVFEHKPKAPKPLASVADTVHQKILDQRVDEAARKHAKTLFAQLQKTGSLQKVTQGGQLSVRKLADARRHQQGVSQALLDKAFTMPRPHKDKPQFAMVSLGNGSFALLALHAVHAGKPDQIPAAQRKMLLTQMQRAYALVAANEWVSTAKRHAKIEIAKDRL